MQEPRYQVGLVVAGYLVIGGLVVLSMWAVGQIQLASRPEGDRLRYWYLIVFLLFELWVALGLVVSLVNFRRGRLIAGGVAFAIWIAALGLSALQESRFHTLFDSEIEGEAALVLADREDAQRRVADLEASYTALAKPVRSIAAIEAELEGYATRRDAGAFPTRITALKSELADAQAYQQAGDDLMEARLAVSATAADVVINVEAKQVGQSLDVFGVEVPSSATIWVLITTMMAIKAFGPWLLLGVSARVLHKPPSESAEQLPEANQTQQPPQVTRDTEWIAIERPDRNGNMQTVKVARAQLETSGSPGRYP